MCLDDVRILMVLMLLLFRISLKKLKNHVSPTINGDGSYSRDFTYIDNVIQANMKALPTEKLMR